MAYSFAGASVKYALPTGTVVELESGFKGIDIAGIGDEKTMSYAGGYKGGKVVRQAPSGSGTLRLRLGNVHELEQAAIPFAALRGKVGANMTDLPHVDFITSWTDDETGETIRKKLTKFGFSRYNFGANYGDAEIEVTVPFIYDDYVQVG